MAKLLAVMLPEPGHIIPALELARALKELGHSICFVTLKHFHNEIRSAGFDCAPVYVSRSLECSGTNLLYSPLSLFDLSNADPKEEREYFLSIFENVRAIKPDLVLVDRVLGYNGPFFNALHVPYLLVGTNFGDGLDPLQSVTLQRTNEILLCPRSIAVEEDLNNTKRYFFDAPISRDRPISSFNWRMIDPGKPLVYCSFGTQVETYPEAPTILREILQYLATNGSCQVVAVAGANMLKEYAGLNLPGVVLTPCAPQLDLLERADVVISHGGLGTIKEALHFAVPMFLIPFAYDQFANAERVARAGYGRQLSSLSWSPSRFKAEYEAFRESLPRLRKNLLYLRTGCSLASGTLSLNALDELLKSVMQSSAVADVANI